MKFTQKLLLPFILLIGLSSYAYGALPPAANDKLVPSISGMLTPVMSAIVNIVVLGDASPSIPDELNNQNQSGPLTQDQNNRRQKPSKRRYEEMASGVIVDAGKGFIVTNAHVVNNAKLIAVTLSDGRRFKAKLIGVDRLSDIAVLQINAKNLTQISMGNSDKLKVGDFVAAIGNPFGLHETVTLGVVSAMHRNDLGIEGYENFIQTDASINPGNSGGALVNLKGELVGINTALVGPVSGNVGIGLSIPTNMVREVMAQLISFGKVQRGVLGVMVQDLTPALADAFNLSGKKGALVTNVTPNSPAFRAGLKIQDIVENINGTPILSGAQLRNIIGLLPIGSKVNVEGHRKDKTFKLEAKIMSPKDLKTASEPSVASFLDGVRMTTYDELIPEFGPLKGLGVLEVDEASDAFISGLHPGDIILEANGHPVTNVDQILQIAKGNSQRLLLKVGRERGMIFLVINKYN